MTKTKVFAVAPEQKVMAALDELLNQSSIDQQATIVSTKAYRHPDIQQYMDLDVPSITEQCDIDVSPEDNVIVIQYNETLISYVNVYRFLRSRGISDFTIKVAGNDPINTTIDDVFGAFC